MVNVNQLPDSHKTFIINACKVLKKDKRIIGVAAGGSFILNMVDEYSDLDLVIVTDPAKYDEILKDKKSVSKSLGPLLESFTGEHVGEPRLLICLYGPSLLHVDLKFISLDDIDNRVEDPVIIWERDSILTDSISKKKSNYPAPDIDWIESRFWVWIHYIAGKIGRGELFEAIESFSFLRTNVLGPMILYKNSERPQGVRRIEQHASNHLDNLKLTLAQHNQQSCMNALQSAIDLYENLRNDLVHCHKLKLNLKLIDEVKKYVNTIEKNII